MAVLAVAAAPAFAQHKRHAGAHEHGSGRLGMAIEGQRLNLELEVPADDIVGFEHAPKTAKQKAAVEAALKTLQGPLELFSMPEAAGCKVAEVKADRTAEGGDHSEFRAVYALDCTVPDKVTSIGFGYFKAFPKAQRLDVTVITAKGQTSYKVRRKQPELTLKGTN
jgi:hypothetical protein